MSFGEMISKADALKLLKEEIPEDIEKRIPKEKIEKYRCAGNRIAYEFAKLDGREPKLHRSSPTRRWYTCGNCGAGLQEVHWKYCPNCGYIIKW